MHILLFSSLRQSQIFFLLGRQIDFFCRTLHIYRLQNDVKTGVIGECLLTGWGQMSLSNRVRIPFLCWCHVMSCNCIRGQTSFRLHHFIILKRTQSPAASRCCLLLVLPPNSHGSRE
ncbi:hypothetical protein BRADI_2g15565v3 [Brachypodium distachyon]|uniref:Uncharacterized protein n=1 Tax=Brachypodium distachyon TaxID=15368 RepID=A0A2K2D8S1_BRADI|nr:hypothetical protein BRADI_2g15565v3 [Brachypodium distachyon]